MKIRTASILFISIIICGLSCTTGNKYVLSEKKLSKVMIDIYLLDAMYSTRIDFPLDYDKIDSAAYYDIVFNEHNISRAQFDSSINYYTQKTEKLDKIYETVITSLSKMEADVNEALNAEMEAKKEKPRELWNEKKTWNIPEDGKHNKLEFAIPIHGPGVYTITAKIRLFEDDESVNPRITAAFSGEDETGKKVHIEFKPEPLKHSSKPLTFSTSKSIEREDLTILEGHILDHSNQDTNWTKHAHVDDISVTFVPKK